MPTYDSSDRYGLRALTGANIGSDIDAGFTALRDDISAKFAGYSQGTLAARPVSTAASPGIAGRRYRATDTGEQFLDTGTSWIQLVLYQEGLLSARPAPGLRGREYRATDTGQIFKDTGTSWIEIPDAIAPQAKVSRMGASQNIATDTPTFVSFDTEDYDTAAMVNIDVNPGRISITRPGVYVVSAHVALESSTFALIVKNAATVIGSSYPVDTDRWAFAHARLAAGDYVQVQVSQNSGVTKPLIVADVEATRISAY